jgi:putative AdoMet-dependent methyltransferase
VRSTHADDFNHDPDAHGYDADVADESNPIRAGYRSTLDWVVNRAAVMPRDVVVDLGTGTGNLAGRLPPRRRLVCVDISARMLELAGAKLGPEPEYVQADLLELFERDDAYDVVVSTYAIHHLTDDEKTALIAAVATRLNPAGRFVIGDLMVASRSAISALRGRLHHEDVDALFEEEFAWRVDQALAAFAATGFGDLVAEQLSPLSWGLAGTIA